MKKVKYKAGTFSSLKDFYNIKDARRYCKELRENTINEIRIIVCKTNKNIILP